MSDLGDMSPDAHIEMWKHYDNLRQSKNNGFLTTNSILVAMVGFLLREPRAFMLIVLIALVGIPVCVSWFLLLSRNVEYIKYHREKAPGGRWRPESRWLLESKWTERTPSFFFVLFWIGVLVFITHIPR